MKQEKSVVNLLLIYLVYIFFYGLIIKFTRGMGVLFTIKTYIPEILLLIIAAKCILITKGRSIRKFSLIGGFYFLCVLVIGFGYYGGSSDAFYLVRDLFLPIFVGIILARKDFHDETLTRFYSIFLKVCMAYLIIGAILGIVEYTNGWEWASRFYAGHTFYGTDAHTKVIITEAYGQLRAPGLTGNHVSFSYYALIAMIVVLASKSIGLFGKAFFMMCGIAILISTTNKTAIVCFALVLALYVFRRLSKKWKYIMLGVTGIIAMIYLSGHLSSNVFLSTFARFDFWKTIKEYVNPIEILVPYKVFAYNPNASGVISFWDNTYLFLLFSTGVFGLIWIYLFCFKMYKKNKGTQFGFMFEQMFLFLILASLFNNITNGRAYFTVFLIMNGFFFKSCTRHGEIEEKVC